MPSFLWMNLTTSTMGITRNARPIATAYSVQEIISKPKALARKGTYSSRVVSSREPGIAAHRTLFWPFRENTDLR